MSPRELGGTERKRLNREWRRRSEARLSLLLDGVGNPFNLGSIIRTAAAYRVEHLWLVGATARPGDAKTQKTALGTDRYLTWSHHETLPPALEAARGAGFRIIGLELADTAQPLHEMAIEGDVCLVVGHEDHGMSKAALSGCDALAYLPQLGKVGSLNVATATALAIYEVRRSFWSNAGEAAL